MKLEGLAKTTAPISGFRADVGPSSSTAQSFSPASPVQVALLTGGEDKSYAMGLAATLVENGIYLDFIGSNRVDGPMLHDTPLINFLNLRGDQSENANIARKVIRIAVYYGRLILYAVTARPQIFHILWNNKFELIDRVFLTFYYRLMGRKIVLTAHNVNAAKRDCRDTFLNRISLRIQYHLSHHIFIHSERMKRELIEDFGIAENKATVIPFGINDTSPTTEITSLQARNRLGIDALSRTVLFFGQIAPYKGLEYLVDAFSEVAKEISNHRLIIAGKVKKGHGKYWDEIQTRIARSVVGNQVVRRIGHVPDADVELYFKAADVLAVPYTQIFQSGLPFLAYSFGLPVIAADVGSLREDVIEGETGFVCRPQDVSDLARIIRQYFSSDLFRHLESRRLQIKGYAGERYSWAKVGGITREVYRGLLAAG